MTITKYKKGDKIAGVYLATFAGDNMYVAEEFGIMADIFDKKSHFECPNIYSKKKGSGKLLEFLTHLKNSLDKPIYFTAITNQGIYKYLQKADIGVAIYDGPKPVFYKVTLKDN